MNTNALIKYPRTPHLEGSRLQAGDDKEVLSYCDLEGRYVVWEEKMDGANSGISFGAGGQLLLQSRGHFLTGGGREKHFNLLKEWATCHQETLFSLLGERYIMFGEWMYAKHSVFYDQLPHYFLEFDLYDKQEEKFLSTNKRQSMLLGTPIVSVPVLEQGVFKLKGGGNLKKFTHALIQPSLGKGLDWRERFAQHVKRMGLDEDQTQNQTDQDTKAEGVYGKIEEGDYCVGRFKYIRSSFTQSILDSNTHWNKRPIVPNLLKNGQDIYAPRINTSWGAPLSGPSVPSTTKKFGGS